ncbi:prolipoprotein diacylglyceryl transferase [Aestuariibius sp. 2305UL40-4]|uniref:prolipoprotein diacylglyceryl transferase n=1 Tax=Aestuariibius violaceus TaxID=3234132 RepID=UPI00345EAEC1
MLAAIPFPEISPEIFSFEVFGLTIALRWYALAYIVGILIGWRLTVVAVKRPAIWGPEGPPMTPKQLEDLLTWIVLGVVLGGRLGSVIFYDPQRYLENPWEIVKIWEGGMAFHGGLLGVVLVLLIFTYRNKIPLIPAADLIALATPPALLLGRIANFINAELWGRPTDLPWGVIFPGQMAQFCPGVEGLCARHPSQLYEAFLEGLLLMIVLLWLAFRRGWLKRPGRITGLFLVGYGVGRFLVEFVRQPDLQFQSPENPLGLYLHVDGVGLTAGQTLSLPMIALGLYLIFALNRRRQPA